MIKKDKKSIVLESTLELISEQGIYSTSMSQISKHAKIAVGTIYLYFPNKEDLINSLYFNIKTDLADYVFKNYSEDNSIEERFFILFKNIINYFIMHPKEFSFVEQYVNSSMIPSHIKEEVVDVFKKANNLFKEAYEKKVIKDLPIEMLIALIDGAIFSIVRLYLKGNIKVDEGLINSGINAIWDSIKR